MPDRSSAMLHRCYGLSKNPLVGAIYHNSVEENRIKLIQTSSKMSTSRLSKQATMQLIKVVGATKDRLQGKQMTPIEDESSDLLFSGSMIRVNDPGKGDQVYLGFLSSLQEALIKDYAAMSVRSL